MSHTCPEIWVSVTKLAWDKELCSVAVLGLLLWTFSRVWTCDRQKLVRELPSLSSNSVLTRFQFRLNDLLLYIVWFEYLIPIQKRHVTITKQLEPTFYRNPILPVFFAIAIPMFWLGQNYENCIWLWLGYMCIIF